MKKVFFLLVHGFLILGFSRIRPEINRSAVLFEHGSGRLGDHLKVYSVAKWISYKYDLPLYYKPFKYSDKLMISKLENVYVSKTKNKFKKIVFLEKEEDLKIEEEASCLYVVKFYNKIRPNFKDKKFITELKKTVRPVFIIDPPSLPGDRISVALHVRKGGGYDHPLLSDLNKKTHKGRPKYFADRRWPKKFSPDSYFIEQTRNIYDILDKKPLHVHLFTDARDPKKLTEKYKQSLKGLDITFSYREKDNHHDKNVIEDMFNMFYFDCLIRGSSHFSLFPQLLGDFYIVINPKHTVWEGDTLLVDEVRVNINKENYYKILKGKKCL